MTEQEKVKLINWLTGQRDACDELHGDGCTDERCTTSRIALKVMTIPWKDEPSRDLAPNSWAFAKGYNQALEDVRK